MITALVETIAILLSFFSKYTGVFSLPATKISFSSKLEIVFFIMFSGKSIIWSDAIDKESIPSVARAFWTFFVTIYLLLGFSIVSRLVILVEKLPYVKSASRVIVYTSLIDFK